MYQIYLGTNESFLFLSLQEFHHVVWLYDNTEIVQSLT